LSAPKPAGYIDLDDCPTVAARTPACADRPGSAGAGSSRDASSPQRTAGTEEPANRLVTDARAVIRSRRVAEGEISVDVECLPLSEVATAWERRRAGAPGQARAARLSAGRGTRGAVSVSAR